MADKNRVMNENRYRNKRSSGDRYIPIRQTTNEWSQLWEEGQEKSIFENTSNISTKKIMSSKNFNESTIFDSMLSNEILNDDIIKISKTGTKIYKSSGQSYNTLSKLFRYSNVERNIQKINNAKNQMKPYFLCPFSDYTLSLMSNVNLDYLKIPTKPEVIIDAPSVTDDFGAKTIDWSSNNLIAYALRNKIYVKDIVTSNCQIFGTTRGLIHTLKFNETGDQLSASTYNGLLEIFDFSSQKSIISFVLRPLKITTFQYNDTLISFGVNSGEIMSKDIREPIGDTVTIIKGHRRNVCGLEWNKNKNLLASGDSEGIVNIWSLNDTTKSLWSLNKHSSSVKAISWSPFNSHVLATGGGYRCQKIIISNCINENILKEKKIQSQICSIVWLKNSGHIILACGIPEFSLNFLNSSELVEIGKLTGYEGRPLHLVVSPDGNKIASISTDDFIKIWGIHCPMNKKSQFRSKLYPFNGVR